MNREETIEWVQSLKPGDKVICIGWTNAPEKILFVNKVTPSGIVRTNHESYKVPSYGQRCSVQGGCGQHIVPYNEDDARVVMYHMEKEKEKRITEAMIRRAKTVCYDLYRGQAKMTSELAEAILKLVEEKTT